MHRRPRRLNPPEYAQTPTLYKIVTGAASVEDLNAAGQTGFQGRTVPPCSCISSMIPCTPSTKRTMCWPGRPGRSKKTGFTWISNRSSSVPLLSLRSWTRPVSGLEALGCVTADNPAFLQQEQISTELHVVLSALLWLRPEHGDWQVVAYMRYPLRQT